MTTTGEARYIHKDCEGVILWDLSGGFCLKCHAEGLDEDDVEFVRNVRLQKMIGEPQWGEAER